ncbi:hypothetical protein BJV78DRAFT_512374 [Lactifluus subvellereus]|nr:hypothetical protein BJV78DRAFT_512374 [Lactifluus subvellereus]
MTVSAPLVIYFFSSFGHIYADSRRVITQCGRLSGTFYVWAITGDEDEGEAKDITCVMTFQVVVTSCLRSSSSGTSVFFTMKISSQTDSGICSRMKEEGISRC